MMAVEGPHPRYGYPWRTVLGMAGQALFGGRRSFRADACACVGRLRPALQLCGAEHVPTCGPALIAVNHYHRPGFGAWWIALAVASVVPAEMHWAMTDEWTCTGRSYAPVGRAGSRWLLRRVAAVYGFTTMPPMPPRSEDAIRRALAVRRLLEFVRDHPAAVLGLAPEGRDTPDGVLSRPAPGTGHLIRRLATLGFRIVPAGAYEQDGRLCLRFGPAYQLEVPPGVSGREADRLVAQTVMRAIAALLPPSLRGEFT
ncbi:MAG: hypothetical protein ACP5UQ_07555 [Anaerolineae bacterium]